MTALADKRKIKLSRSKEGVFIFSLLYLSKENIDKIYH